MIHTNIDPTLSFYFFTLWYRYVIYLFITTIAKKGEKPYRWQFSDKYPQKTRNNSRRTMLICFSLLQEKNSFNHIYIYYTYIKRNKKHNMHYYYKHYKHS